MLLTEGLSAYTVESGNWITVCISKFMQNIGYRGGWNRLMYLLLLIVVCVRFDKRGRR